MARSYVFRLESKRPLHEVIRAVEALGLVRSFREDTGSELQPVPKKVTGPVTKPPRPDISAIRSAANNARSALYKEKIAKVLLPIFAEDPDAPTWKAIEALNKSDVKPWKGSIWAERNVQPHIQYVLDLLTKPGSGAAP